MEFMFMIMAASTMVIIFTVVFSEIYQDNLSDKKEIIFRDYGQSLQNEFIVAREAYPGYYREFEVYQNLEGFDYEIRIIGSYLFLNYTDNVFQAPIGDVDGSIAKGVNTIQNINNSICLNC